MVKRHSPHRATILAAALALLALVIVQTVRADGWHNAALATASLDDWLRDIKTAVPDIDQRLAQSELQGGKGVEALKAAARAAQSKTPAAQKSAVAGGSLANLTGQQQQLLARKAGDCLEVIAYMDPKNIFPYEFPMFQLGKIPEYRKTAKKLLGAMGPAGAQAVAGRLQAELMGNVRYASDVSPTADYAKDLMEVFGEMLASGQLSMEDADALALAAAGKKTGPTAGMAKKINEMLDTYVSVPTLLKWKAATDDPARKKQLSARLQKRMAQASQAELLEALESPEADAPLRAAISLQLKKLLPDATIADLLNTLEKIEDKEVQKSVSDALAKRSPTFSEVKDQLPDIIRYGASADATVAQAARLHLVNAFQRAPVGHCLYWAGQGDAKLSALIWEQMDARIARADPERKGSYAQTAVSVLEDSTAGSGSRVAALDLLGRLRHRQAVGGIVESLPQLPRELWPAAGAALEKITAQQFGPKKGDGAAEVSVAVKKWREWWKANGAN